MMKVRVISAVVAVCGATGAIDPVGPDSGNMVTPVAEEVVVVPSAQIARPSSKAASASWNSLASSIGYGLVLSSFAVFYRKQIWESLKKFGTSLLRPSEWNVLLSVRFASIFAFASGIGILAKVKSLAILGWALLYGSLASFLGVNDLKTDGDKLMFSEIKVMLDLTSVRAFGLIMSMFVLITVNTHCAISAYLTYVMYVSSAALATFNKDNPLAWFLHFLPILAVAELITGVVLLSWDPSLALTMFYGVATFIVAVLHEEGADRGILSSLMNIGQFVPNFQKNTKAVVDNVQKSLNRESVKEILERFALAPIPGFEGDEAPSKEEVVKAKNAPATVQGAQALKIVQEVPVTTSQEKVLDSVAAPVIEAPAVAVYKVVPAEPKVDGQLGNE